MTTPDKPEKPPDKRRAPRLALAKGTKAHVRSSVVVELKNLSATGLLMEVPMALRPGSTLDLNATLAGIHFTALIRITRCRAGGFAPDEKGGRVLVYEAGGEFVALQQEQMTNLSRAIEKIGGAKLASQSSAFLRAVRPS